MATNTTTIDPFQNCTSVTPQCPVEGTTYGYTPNLAANIILLSVFALLAIAQLFLAIKTRLPTFGTVVTAGCVTEVIGYVGRLIMNNNPWDDTGFKTNVVRLILAPSFLAAGIYLTLKHTILTLGRAKSRLAPHLYTWIFISADALSIILQAAGGAISSSSDDDKDMQDVGNNLMIAGVTVQVATMAICFVLAIDFGIWVVRSGSLSRKGWDGGEGSGAQMYARTGRFRFYLGCTGAAFTLIFVLYIYRLPEMAGGWGNELMRQETEFLVLDGAMIAIACILLTVAHPGIFFPDMRIRKAKSEAISMESLK